MANQVFDHGRSCGWCTEPTASHCLSQFFIFNELSSCFHGRQQRRIRVAGGRLGLVWFNRGFDVFCGLSVGNSAKFVFVSGCSRLAVIKFEVSRNNQDPSVRFEAVLFDPRDPLGNFKLGMREKDPQESLKDEFVKFCGCLIKFRRRDFACWNNRKVIADLGGVEHSFGWPNPIVVDDPFATLHERLRKRRIGFRFRESLYRTFYCVEIIFWQVFRIGTRISQQFMSVVERLGQLQCSFGAESKFIAGLALKTRQIKQQRRGLFGRFLVFLDLARFAFAARANRLGFFQ